MRAGYGFLPGWMKLGQILLVTVGAFAWQSAGDIFREHAALSDFENDGTRDFDIGACAGLRLPIWERLADASYAIYLFHWASFGALKPVTAWLQGEHGPGSSPGAATWPLMALHILVAVCSGLLVHRWVERPLCRWAQGRLGLRPSRLAVPASG